jgi:hypothetical protein
LLLVLSGLSALSSIEHLGLSEEMAYPQWVNSSIGGPCTACPSSKLCRRCPSKNAWHILEGKANHCFSFQSLLAPNDRIAPSTPLIHLAALCNETGNTPTHSINQAYTGIQTTPSLPSPIMSTISLARSFACTTGPKKSDGDFSVENIAVLSCPGLTRIIFVAAAPGNSALPAIWCSSARREVWKANSAALEAV